MAGNVSSAQHLGESQIYYMLQSLTKGTPSIGIAFEAIDDIKTHFTRPISAMVECWQKGCLLSCNMGHRTQTLLVTEQRAVP